MCDREVQPVRGPEVLLRFWPAPEVQAKVGPVKPEVFGGQVRQDRKKLISVSGAILVIVAARVVSNHVWQRKREAWEKGKERQGPNTQPG